MFLTWKAYTLMKSLFYHSLRLAKEKILPIALIASTPVCAFSLQPEPVHSNISCGVQQRLDTLQEQLAQMQIRGDVRAVADTLRSMAELDYSCSLLDEAIENFTRSSEKYRRLEDRTGEASTLTEIGSIYLERRRWLEAMPFLKQAVPLWRGIDRSHEAVTLGKVAEVFRGLGDMDEAVKFDERALSIFIELGDKPEQAAVLNNIGMAKSTGAHRDKSLRFFLQARALYHEIGDSRGEATTLINLAAVHSLCAKQNEALVALTEALRLSVNHGHRAQEAEALSRIGVAYAALGQERFAHEFWARAIALYRELGDDQGLGRTREAMASFEVRNEAPLHKGNTRDSISPTDSLVVKPR